MQAERYEELVALTEDFDRRLVRFRVRAAHGHTAAIYTFEWLGHIKHFQQILNFVVVISDPFRFRWRRSYSNSVSDLNIQIWHHCTFRPFS